MKVSTKWNGGMQFESSDGSHSALMDSKAPFGKDTALSPKQLLLAAVMGCTGIDVISLMKKHKQDVQKFWLEADAPISDKQKYPAVFSHIQLDYYFEGAVEKEKAIEAVMLSQTLYCGVSAMVSKAMPIHNRIHLNGELIHEEDSKFKF
jgi:putative redox protein